MSNAWPAALALVGIAVLTAGGALRVREADAALHAAAFDRARALAAAAVELARRERVLWLHTDALLGRASRRLAAGDAPGAFRLAAAARREALLARNQARLEAARYALGLHRATLAPAAIGALEAALKTHDGAAALALARRFELLDGR